MKRDSGRHVHGKICGPRQQHPLRDLGPRAIRLENDIKNIRADLRPADDGDRHTGPGVKSVIHPRLTRGLFLRSMSLLRRAPANPGWRAHWPSMPAGVGTAPSTSGYPACRKNCESATAAAPSANGCCNWPRSTCSSSMTGAWVAWTAQPDRTCWKSSTIEQPPRPPSSPASCPSNTGMHGSANRCLHDASIFERLIRRAHLTCS